MSIDISAANGSSNISFLSLETGILEYTNGRPTLRLNGDEYRITLPADKSKIFQSKYVSILMGLFQNYLITFK